MPPPPPILKGYSPNVTSLTQIKVFMGAKWIRRGVEDKWRIGSNSRK